VWNKIDLVADRHPASGSRAAAGQRQLVSALTGDGIAELVAAIGGALVPLAPPPGAAIAFTREQVAHLERACQAVHEKHAAKAEAALAALLACE
jgi:50S ribosomal subunit-associated GTPase HflX